MPVVDLYHKRLKRLEAPNDVFSYDEVPERLRIQIIQIMLETLGDKYAYSDEYGSGPNVVQLYFEVVTTLRKEIGVFKLPSSLSSRPNDFLIELLGFLHETKDTGLVLSAIELICRAIEVRASMVDYRRRENAPMHAKDAIDEINERFREHAIGYQYDGEIIRIDNELVHAEAVKPALALLRNRSFRGAEEEFLNAFAHHRKGHYKEALKL